MCPLCLREDRLPTVRCPGCGNAQSRSWSPSRGPVPAFRSWGPKTPILQWGGPPGLWGRPSAPEAPRASAAPSQPDVERERREPNTLPVLLFAWALVVGTVVGLGSSFPDVLNAIALGGLALAPGALGHLHGGFDLQPR